MTKPTETGLVLARIAEDLEEYALQNNKALTALAEQILAGDTTGAFLAVLAMKDRNTELLRIMTLLRHKHITDAAASAERLAASNKAVFDRQR